MRVNMKNRILEEICVIESNCAKDKWERLKDSDIKEEYERRTEELMSERMSGERGWKNDGGEGGVR